MALPMPESAAGPREDIIRLLERTPEGLSDSEIAQALGNRSPGLNAKAVNHQCRRLVAAGAAERVGTRPVRTRLVVAPAEISAEPEVALASAGEGHTAQPERASDLPEVPLVSVGDPTPVQVLVEGHTAQLDQASDVPEVPLDDGAVPAPALPPVQRSIVRALDAVPDGLTDTGIAAALASTHPELDPKAFNYQCRKLVKAGLVDRTARSKDAPIRTRLTAAGAAIAAEGHTTAPEPVPDLPDVPLAPTEPTEPSDHSEQDESGTEHPEPALVGARSRRPRRRAKAPSDDVARIRRSERDGDDPDEPLLRFLPFAPAATARTALRERMAERAALRRAPEPTDDVVLPVRDVLQGWSRTQNVAAAVASWLTRRGGTIRTAHAVGPAHDLVASLDGDDVHVEVTGWPPDGARSHPTTLAGDWFRAASRAAAQRRRAHPRGRVVIAVPDTRRYRALAEEDADGLGRVRAEVWFVDPSGAVELS